MMKLNSVSWSVPGAKCCVHRNRMTAVVSDTDSIYLYKGGSGKPLRILAFNPRTGRAGYIEYRMGQQFSMQELEQQKDAKQIYEQGLQLLKSAHYAPAQPEKEKILEWMQSLLERPLINREKVKEGNRLIASLENFRVDEAGKPVMPKSIRCSMLGNFTFMDGSYNLIFQVENDPDLKNGIWIDEKDDHTADVNSISCGITWHDIATYHKITQLTREEAKWLGKFLPPFPEQRFLHVHNELTENEGPENSERVIRRAVSRAAGHCGPGTVVV